MSTLDTSYEVSSGLLPEGDRVQASSVEGHLLIVKVLDRIDHIDTKHQPDASAVILDVWDLNTQTNYINVCWFNGAIVDNLAKDRHLGGNPIAIKLTSKQGKNQAYLVPEAAQGQDLETAGAWLNSRPNVFEETRQQRGEPAYDRGLAAGTIQQQAPAPQAAFGGPPAPQQQAPAPQAAQPPAPQQQYQQPPAPQAPPAAPQQQYQQPPAPQDDPWASAPQQQAPQQQYAPPPAPEQQYQQGAAPVGAPMQVPQPQVGQQAQQPPQPGAPAGPNLPF